MVKLAKPHVCPECLSTQVAEILYGVTSFDSQLENELDEGRVVLGGCQVVAESPRWECQVCNHRWGGIEPQPRRSTHDIFERREDLRRKILAVLEEVG